jgi:hypothetical protein
MVRVVAGRSFRLRGRLGLARESADIVPLFLLTKDLPVDARRSMIETVYCPRVR